MWSLRTSAIALAAALITAACQGGTPSPAGGGPTGTAAQAEKLVVVYGQNLPKGSWLLETDDAFALANAGVTEMLTKIDFEGNLKPNLATQWTQTSPTVWEFTLRDGVKFQDGTTMDAAAVTNSLTKLLQAKTPARSFNPRTVSSVEAVGANKVKITTVAPSPLLPLIVASPNTAIMAAKGYGPTKNDPLGTGTGPFTMTRDDAPQQSITMKGNEAYWGGKVALKEVEIRWVTDIGTRATLARTGEAGLVRNVAVASLTQLKATPGLKIVNATVPRTTTLYLNNSKPPLNNARVRQAIQAAIDVKSIANDVLEGAVQPAVGPFAPTQPYAPSGAQPAAYDIEKAKSLMSQAGVDPTKTTLSLWTYPGRADLPVVAVAIQSMLKKLGINVEIRVAEYNSFEADALAGKHDMALISRGYLSDINDPLNYLIADFGCKGAYRMSQHCDAAVDDKLAKAGTNSDATHRYAAYKEIAAQIQSQAVSVFMYHETDINVHTERLSNLKIHPLNNYLLTPELSLRAK